MFVMLYSIIWPNLIVWLPLLLAGYEMRDNLCIAIVCFPGCDVINFEINFTFLINPLSFLTKKSSQKFKHLENENSFYSETKRISHLLKGFSVDKIVSHQKVRL